MIYSKKFIITFQIIFLLIQFGSCERTGPKPNQTGILKNLGKPFYTRAFSNPTPYNQIKQPKTAKESYIPKLEVSCYVHNPDHLNIIIRDADKERYEIPFEDPYPYPRDPQSLDIKDSNFEFVPQVDPFDIIIRRKSTQEVIFRLTDRLVYTDLYQEFSFNTPTKEIYGLGMRLSPLQFKPGIYTLFLLDRSGLIDHGVPGFNGQGHHSMYLMKEQSGNYHTFFLRNVNFGEVTIYPDNKLKWQLTGGVLDFNFFLGDTPESSLDKYHIYLDGWALPALWHLGYHQNKWAGYRNYDEIKAVIDGFKSKNIPLESLWTDTEHMKDNINFSVDEEKFPLDKINTLYAKNKLKFIPIFNAHLSLPLIPPVSEYPNLEELYMKDSLGENCSGEFLWGEVMFIDYLNPKCEPFLDKMIWETDKKWKLHGAWLDANEVSNLAKRENPITMLKDPQRKYFYLPFYPGIQNLYELQIVNLDCIHYNGQEEYNMRAYSSLFQSKYAYDSLKKKFPYPFVLGRSTMPGGGKYFFTWIPDIWSTWDHLKISNAVLLTYGMFGYGISGVDVCGFISADRVDAELCARWHQVSAFYPFTRNSHVLDFANLNNYQEPYLFTGVHFDAIYASIILRYRLLKYIYAIIFTKKSLGLERKIGSVLRPLFYDYHNEETLPPYGDDVHETQILLGEAVMLATVNYPNILSVEVYFPNQRWYDLRNYQEVPTRGGRQNISAAITELMPYFLKGGNIVMIQNVEGVMTTEDLDNTYSFIIGLNDIKKKENVRQANAEGKILAVSSYEEQYVYDHCTKQNCVLIINAIYEHSEEESRVTITAKGETPNSFNDPIQLNEIILMGVPLELSKDISNVKLEGQDALKIDLQWETGKITLKFKDLDVQNNTQLKFIFS